MQSWKSPLIKMCRHFYYPALLSIVFLSIFFTSHSYAAQCGYANGSSYSSAPQAVGSLCVAGTAGGVTGNGPWNWTCTDGGGTVNCSSGICGVNFEWREGTFSTCDCATSLQSRGVWCYRNGVMTDPDQSGCYANAGPKPAWQQSCTPSGCVTPVAGACDNNTVNGCSSGSAFDISSDASNDYWKCSGTNGGANSGQCQKAKPPVACIPSGQPVPAGQTQCPTNSCFFWVSGIQPSYRDNFGTYEAKIGDSSLTWMAGGTPTEFGSFGGAMAGSNMVGAGQYADAYGDDINPGPFYYAANGSFDGIAIGSNTRVTIYDGTNFSGAVLFDQTGPIVISNKNNQSTPGMAVSPRSGWKGENWSSLGAIGAQFPASTRKNSDEAPVSMPANGPGLWRLSGLPPEAATAHNLIGGYGRTSIRVTCNP